MYDLENKAPPNLKKKEVLNKINLKTNIYMIDCNYTTKNGINNFHQTRGTHSMNYVNDLSLSSFVYPPIKILSSFISKKCSFSEYKKEKRHFFVTYCLCLFT